VAEPHDPASGRPDLGEELGKLVTTVQELVRRALPDAAIGHGGPECQWCPICQLVNLLRGEHPEITDRIAEAGSAVAAALKAATDAVANSAGGDAAARPKPSPSRVQRIDLSDPGES
jgi:hypothetical protein